MTWGYWCNRLEKLPKRLIRIKSWSKYSAQTEPLLNQLELLNLSDLLELSASKFSFKYLHGSLPRFFYSFNIATQGTQHSHDTCQCDQRRVDRSIINLADNRIRIFLPTLVNSTALQLVHKITTHTIQGFSYHIKRYLINRFRDNCSNTGPRFNIKMTSYQYRKSHCGDKTILRPSYLHNGISYTGKTTSLYWIRALIAMCVNINFGVLLLSTCWCLLLVP